MYKIAKKLKILKIGVILQNIVLPGFDTSCKGFITMNRVEKSNQRQKTNLPEKKRFFADIQNFASVGLKLSSSLYGEENAQTLTWKSRKADPIAYFESLSKQSKMK